MGFVPKLRVWFVPKSPNLGFVPKVPKFLISSPLQTPKFRVPFKRPQVAGLWPPKFPRLVYGSLKIRTPSAPQI